MNKIYIYKNITSKEIINIIAKDNNIRKYNILKNQNGKPYFEDNNIYFNISHNNSLIVAVTSNNEIGIDIQKKKYIESVLERNFTKEEKDYVKKHINKEKAFTRIWTMKESYLKKIGTGISYGLKKVNTSNLVDKFKIIECEDYIITICE